jgi:hypothetical protein
MPRLNGLRGRAFPQARRLGRKGRCAKADLKAASGRCEPVKSRQHKVVQHRLESNRRIFCQRIPQRQRAMRCQLGDQPIRQSFRPVLIVFFRISSAAGHRDDRALDGSISRIRVGRLRVAALPDIRIVCRHVVLRPDVTPIHREAAFGIDADEDAGADYLGRIVNHRPVFERDQCRLDFAEALIDLIG